MHAVVIPFRGPASAKSRLADGLSDAARRQIARAMFQHVLNVACATSGPRNVVVVTGSRTAAAIARRVGASVLREKIAGHNDAVTQAIDHVRMRGATSATIVSADLPLLEVMNLESLERGARSGSLCIAPDHSGGGTNAISMPLSLPMRFHFGDESLFLHASLGRRLGARVRFVKQSGLARDVDTPDELVLLNEPGALATLPTAGPRADGRRMWTSTAAMSALVGEYPA